MSKNGNFTGILQSVDLELIAAQATVKLPFFRSLLDSTIEFKRQREVKTPVIGYWNTAWGKLITNPLTNIVTTKFGK